ncbi:MAG: hypothetical protein QM730_26455 [Anaerolineales bacterium]
MRSDLLVDAFVQIIFGWPAVIATIILSVAGLALKKPILLVIAGFVCMPFTYYASNGLRNPLIVLPLLEFASAYAVTYNRKIAAFLLIAPFFIVSALLAYAVLTQ